MGSCSTTTTGTGRTSSTRAGSPTASTSCSCPTRSTSTPRPSSRRATCSSSPPATPTGNPQCSYKGGDPGFVRVVDDHTLAFPVYDGNGMFLSLGNIRGQAARRDAVRRLRTAEPAPRQRGRHRRRRRSAAAPSSPARRSWCACGRRRCSRTAGVTSTRCSWSSARVRAAARRPTPPIPDWKRMTWAQEYLPEADPARASEPIG